MESPRRTRVLVVDDQPAVRRALRATIAATPDLECIADAPDGATAIDLCQSLEPDIVLLDLILPDMDGAQVAAVISSRWPRIVVVGLTSSAGTDLADAMLASGARVVLPKTITTPALLAALRGAKQHGPG